MVKTTCVPFGIQFVNIPALTRELVYANLSPVVGGLVQLAARPAACDPRRPRMNRARSSGSGAGSLGEWI